MEYLGFGLSETPYTWPNGEPAELTDAQRTALAVLRERYPTLSYVLSPNFGCVMVGVAGMILGIERDGYTHS